MDITASGGTIPTGIKSGLIMSKETPGAQISVGTISIMLAGDIVAWI